MNKIVCITGATAGIGEATAHAFAAEGFNLILCGRRLNRLKKLEEELSKKVKVNTLKFDVGIQKEVQEAFDSLPDDWKNIDVLINNAGNAHGWSHLVDNQITDWNKMLDFNVKGLLYVSKMVIPRMIENQKGHIINISSIAGKEVYENGVVYCASKAAVESISKGMRLELVPHQIKVTNIAPGAVNTEFSTVRFKGDKERAEDFYKGFDPLLAKDIASSILWCVQQPKNVQIADITILASAQSNITTITKNL